MDAISMLKSRLIVHQDVDISLYPKLKAFLKRKAQVNKFIKEAPDNEYVLQKVSIEKRKLNWFVSSGDFGIWWC